MVETLVARLPRERLRASSTVRSLARDADGFVLGVDGGAVAARAAIVAAPAAKAAPLLAPLLPEVANVLAAIPFASSATVLLGYRRAQVRHPLNGYGMVVPAGEGLRSSACSFVSTKFPGRAPEGHVLLRGFLGGTRDPSVLELDDDGLVGTVRREMAQVLGISGEPVLARVFRWPAGTPQLEVGHLDRMLDAEQRVAAIPGLVLTGAGLRSTGIPDTVAEGQRAAAAAALAVETRRAALPSLAPS
jgi:oxygen-dependent protoporphyrinogen oxidase